MELDTLSQIGNGKVNVQAFHTGSSVVQTGAGSGSAGQHSSFR